MAEETLDKQPTDALVELFFDCEAPDERDALFDVLASRTDAIARSFLTAVLLHDEDPFLQVAAAGALLPHDPEGATAFLLAQLDAQDDELLFEEALSALLRQPPAAFAERLAGISAERSRDLAERRLAKLALLQLDEAQAREACLQLLQDPQAILHEPLELLSVALSALVRAGTPEALAALTAAQERLPRPHSTGDGDGEGDTDQAPDLFFLDDLHDLFDEARTLVAAAGEDDALRASQDA